MKKYIIAIDLHGTLLDDKWKISKRHHYELITLIKELKEYVSFYICTGNDYDFVVEHLPEEIVRNMNGFILETGCIMYKNENKTYLTSEKIRREAIELQNYFYAKDYYFIKQQGKRESTITLFTSDKKSGRSPEFYYDIIYKDLQQHKFKDNFYITWSNVAIDIIPREMSKWYTLKNIKDKLYFEDNSYIISFVDSYNDKEIANFSNYTFLPLNSSSKLIDYLRYNNKLIFKTNKFHTMINQCYKSDKLFSEAVIDGLNQLKESRTLVN